MRKQLVLAEMRKFAFEPDWGDEEQDKWILILNCVNGKIDFDISDGYIFGGDILYFASADRARECIAAVGEDKIKKCYFKVKP